MFKDKVSDMKKTKVKVLSVVTAFLATTTTLVSTTSLSSCVNGKNEKGTVVNADSLAVPDTVATLNPNGDDKILIDGMGTCQFNDFFAARVENGVVKCQFHDFDNELFSSIFSENCPREEITVQNIEGSCCGIACIVEGGGVDPVLFMIMDDGHAERISLYDLSSGEQRAKMRSDQKGLVGFATDLILDENSDYEIVVGLRADSSHVQLKWEDN